MTFSFTSLSRGRFCRTLSTSFYISKLWLRDWFELTVKFFHKIGSYVEYGWLPRTQVQCTFSMFWYVLWLSAQVFDQANAYHFSDSMRRGTRKSTFSICVSLIRCNSLAVEPPYFVVSAGC